MKPVSIVLIAAVIFLMIILGFNAPALSAEKKPILIGHVHTMSGPMSMYGISCDTAGQIAVDEINAAGGVLGRPLKMITRDDKLNPEVGRREARDLVLNQHVDFLTGTISSGVAQAIWDYAREAKKIFIINISQSTKLTEELGHRYGFRMTTNVVPYCQAPLDLYHKKYPKDKKIITMALDYEWGHNSADLQWEKYKEIVPDAKLVKQLWPPLSTTDFRPYITSILASGADGLFASIYGGLELTFVKQAWGFGLYDKMHVVEQCAGDPETWDTQREGDPYPKGAIVSSRYPYWLFTDAKNKAFVKEHYKRCKIVSPSYGAMDQYTIIYALKKAIEKAGSVDTEKVVDALEGMEVDSLVGKFKIRAYDHQALMPTWVGVMGFSHGLPFPVITNAYSLGEESYHSVEYIKRVRAKK
jgi:branched-chain amino acid transport system substrate-binding protein